MIPVSRLWFWFVGFFSFFLLFLEMSGPKSSFSVKLGCEGQSELEDMLEPSCVSEKLRTD